MLVTIATRRGILHWVELFSVAFAWVRRCVVKHAPHLAKTYINGERKNKRCFEAAANLEDAVDVGISSLGV